MTIIVYDLWIDTGTSYKLTGGHLSKSQIDEIVRSLPRDKIAHYVVSQEQLDHLPIWTKAIQWRKFNP